MPKSFKRVAIVNNIIAPYRVPLFKAMNNQTPTGYRVEFVFLSKIESVRHWVINQEFTNSPNVRVLPTLLQIRNRFSTTSDHIINRSFLKYIFYDIVILFGYNYATYIIILLGRRILQKRTILFCESTSFEKTGENFLKKLVKTALIGCADDFIVPGVRSKQYIERYRPKGHVTIAKNAVQPVKTQICSDSLPKITDQIRLLFVGRLSEEKNLQFALDALSQSDLKYRLIVAGTGPLETFLRSHYQSENVRFIGETSTEDLAVLYSNNDILILPSVSEPWGLVVNEALNHGMPALVSDKVGCAPDLLATAGKVFSLQHELEFIDNIRQMYSELDSFRAAAKVTAQHVTIEAQAERFWQVIEQ